MSTTTNSRNGTDQTTPPQQNATNQANALGNTVFAGLGADAAGLVTEDMFQGYQWDYDHRTNDTAEALESDAAYKVSEHLLWAPRKIRVASIGAGASGIMLCYKKEKEFKEDIDLVVYDRETTPQRRRTVVSPDFHA
jgi:hypothetical protein